MKIKYFLIGLGLMVLLVACNNNVDSSGHDQSFDITGTTSSSATDNDDDAAGTTTLSDIIPDVTGDNDTNGTDNTDNTGTDVTDDTVAAIAPEEGAIASNALSDEAIAKLPTKKQGFGMGKMVDKNNRPEASVAMQKKYGKYDAHFIKEIDKCIYLTFDEGYEQGHTGAILDTLKEKKVSATFFITYDYAKRNADLVKRMIDEGHIVGNHSYSHPSMPTLSIEKAKEEIQLLHDYIKEEFAYEMWLFRPPMGEFSEQSLAITQKMGYKSVFWSFAYVDWNVDSQMGRNAAYKKVTDGTHEGAIYLLHAVSKDNADILGDVIDYWREQGLQVKAFS